MSETTSPQVMLHCSDCGNMARFVEIMRFESHLVDGSLNYLHLLEADADHYICFQCGKKIAVEEIHYSE